MRLFKFIYSGQNITLFIVLIVLIIYYFNVFLNYQSKIDDVSSEDVVKSFNIAPLRNCYDPTLTIMDNYTLWNLQMDQQLQQEIEEARKRAIMEENEWEKEKRVEIKRYEKTYYNGLEAIESVNVLGYMWIFHGIAVDGEKNIAIFYNKGKESNKWSFAEAGDLIDENLRLENIGDKVITVSTEDENGLLKNISLRIFYVDETKFRDIYDNISNNE